ncbi:RidA family protein [Microbacterium sp. LMI1x-1-1.1]|uniref:RidA family protein n=1 Tax=Microbacterium sp. LMI1x-1-1.1 TaxID=3135246 RepID=UPI003417AB5D
MSAVRLVRSEGLAAAPYAYAAHVEARAELIFLAGACPLADDGSTVAVGDVAGQAQRCVETMLVALDAAGATLSDVASTRVLVASSDRHDLVAAWNVVREAFGEHDVPSTLMGVAALGYEDQLVEIEAVAAVRGG